MYENVHRMMNGYRPVLYDNTDAFFFKPHMDRGRLRTLPPGDRGVEETLRRARESFDEDFWARPRHRFPYLGSLLRAYGADYFVLRKLQKRLRLLGLPEFHLSYRNGAITEGIFAVLDDYAERASGWGVTPVAVFIPRNRLDLRSVSRLLEEAGDRLPEGLIVGDVGARPGVDWERFNLIETDGDDYCHPSAYGYGVIAETVASLLPSASVAARR